MSVNFNNVAFFKSASDPKGFVRDKMIQVAFAGRSNVGKSSVLNRLFNRKNFARVGATPGKTQQINYFKVDNALYFVDLPGYGYAKVSQSEKDRWSSLMESYFQEEGLISLGVLIVDARHKPTQDDITMYNFFKDTNCPCIVLANKLDKLKKSEVDANMQLIYDTLEISDETPLIPFSAETGVGKNECIAAILENIK